MEDNWEEASTLTLGGTSFKFKGSINPQPALPTNCIEFRYRVRTNAVTLVRRPVGHTTEISFLCIRQTHVQLQFVHLVCYTGLHKKEVLQAVPQIWILVTWLKSRQTYRKWCIRARCVCGSTLTLGGTSFKFKGSINPQPALPTNCIEFRYRVRTNAVTLVRRPVGHTTEISFLCIRQTHVQLQFVHLVCYTGLHKKEVLQAVPQIWILVTWLKSRQTYRKWCIRARCAYAQVGSKICDY